MELSGYSFGARITKLRLQSGYSLQELADKIGVSKVALWKWENESVIPRAERLKALSSAFGVSVTYLTTGSKAQPEEVAHHAEALRETILEAKQAIADAAGIRLERVTISIIY